MAILLQVMGVGLGVGISKANFSLPGAGTRIWFNAAAHLMIRRHELIAIQAA